MIENITSSDSELQISLATCILNQCSFNYPFLLLPNDESKSIQVKYTHTFKTSKTLDTKFVTIWTNETYIPFPAYVFDKTLFCTFESIKTPITHLCHEMELEGSAFYFGYVAEGYTQRRVLNITNMNPVPIFIDDIDVVNPQSMETDE